MKNLIKNDNLEQFKKQFNPLDWRDTVARISNYTNKWSKNTKKDKCDSLKYAVHCQADKIFHYLLDYCDVNPYITKDGYGYPILRMALENDRYDYAEKIINHPSFDLYQLPHLNSLSSPEDYPNQAAHMEYMKNYLSKIKIFSFLNPTELNLFYEVLSWNKEAYQHLENLYLQQTGKKSLLEMYQDEPQIICKCVFRNYNHEIALMLPEDYIKKFLEYNLEFSNMDILVFITEKANKEGLELLLKEKDLFFKILYQESTLVSYLSKENTELLINYGFDIFEKNTQGLSPIDFMLFSDEKRQDNMYLLEIYRDKIKSLLKDKKENYPEIESYFLQHQLNIDLPTNHIEAKKPKI